MAPHQKTVTRAGTAQLAKILKKKKNVPVKKTERREPVRAGDTIPVENSGHSLEVLEKLGNGTFGEVFKVKMDYSSRPNAMKIVRADTPCEVQAANEEAAFLMNLGRFEEFIVNTMFTFWFSRENQKVMCIVSELLDKPLSAMIDLGRGRPFQAQVAKAIGFQVLSALECLHDLGCVTHCDIKPDNVMLVNLEKSPLRVKLIDFGLAEKTTKLRQGSRMQNIMYRAPEVVFKLPLNEKVDIWGTAVMLNEIYTGLDLFPAQHVPELARYIEGYVGLPHEVQTGAVTAEFLIHDVEEGKQTVMSFAETQSEGLLDVEYDERPIPSLQQVPEFGYNYLGGNGVTDEDRDFLDVLLKMLKPDVVERFGAREALQMPFFTSFDGNYNP